MIPPPRSVRILGQRFPVRHVKRIIDNDGQDMDALGAANYDGQQIELAIEGTGPDRGPDVMMHEVLHLIFSFVHYEVGDEEEAIIRRVAPLLRQTLKDNPKLVKYLRQRAP